MRMAPDQRNDEMMQRRGGERIGLLIVMNFWQHGQGRRVQIPSAPPLAIDPREIPRALIGISHRLSSRSASQDPQRSSKELSDFGAVSGARERVGIKMSARLARHSSAESSKTKTN